MPETTGHETKLLKKKQTKEDRTSQTDGHVKRSTFGVHRHCHRGQYISNVSGNHKRQHVTARSQLTPLEPQTVYQNVGATRNGSTRDLPFHLCYTLSCTGS